MQKYIELILECLAAAFGILYYVFTSKGSESSVPKGESEVSDPVPIVEDQ